MTTTWLVACWLEVVCVCSSCDCLLKCFVRLLACVLIGSNNQQHQELQEHKQEQQEQEQQQQQQQ